MTYPTSKAAVTGRVPIIRKSALFAGSDGGGRTWATIATLLPPPSSTASTPMPG